MQNPIDIIAIPTFGVTEATIGDWLRLKSGIAVGGTWIARTQDFRDGRCADIIRSARAAGRVAAQARETRL